MAKRLSDEQIAENMAAAHKLVGMFRGERKARVSEMLSGKTGEEFFTAPASTREEYHSCYPGGLVEHSLNVVRTLKKLADTLDQGRWETETLVFVALFHDLGKSGDGAEPAYIPNPSDWHRNKGMLYENNRKCAYMPTAERSLYLLQKSGVTVTPQEYLAIRLHDGLYEETNKKYAMKEPDLALLLHWADRWSTSEEKR